MSVYKTAEMNVRTAWEMAGKGEFKAASKWMDKASEIMSGDKFKMESKRGKEVSALWNHVFDLLMN